MHNAFYNAEHSKHKIAILA